MGRTPNYNNGNGKDHWSIGSIMFLGRGIKGNRVIGATDEKQFARPARSRRRSPATRRRASASAPSTSTKRLRQFAGIADHPFARSSPSA